MSKLTVIDADSPCWWAAVFIDKDIVNGEVAEDDMEEIRKRVCGSVKRTITKIIEQTECDEYLPVLTGGGNFRKTIYPEYKANRTKADRPPHLGIARQYLIDYHNAHVADGMEADDYLAIASTMGDDVILSCLLYTSPSPRDRTRSRMPSSA